MTTPHTLQPNMRQTQIRGTNQDEYDIYLARADDGEGFEIMTGRELKTFDEWMGLES